MDPGYLLRKFRDDGTTFSSGCWRHEPRDGLGRAKQEPEPRAYRDVFTACLRSKCPALATTPRYSNQPDQPIPLGALLQFGYAKSMREFTDEQLMHRYAKGNAQAFDQLYERNRGPLYRYFLRQVNNPTTANDLYQGTWEKIIKARRSYRPTAPFTVWMYRIAHNHLVDHYRRSRPADPIEADTLIDQGSGPIEDVMDGEQRDNLWAGIIALPTEQKNTLLLKLETGLRMEDIARVTGVSRETVKSRLRYAVNKLKQVVVE